MIKLNFASWKSDIFQDEVKVDKILFNINHYLENKNQIQYGGKMEKWKNNFRVIYNTLTLRVALATFSAVQYLENKNQIQYGGKMEK